MNNLKAGRAESILRLFDSTKGPSKNYEDISRELGLHRSTVIATCKELGVSGVNTQSSRKKKRLHAVKALLDKGISAVEIAKMEGFYQRQVYRDIQELNKKV